MRCPTLAASFYRNVTWWYSRLQSNFRGNWTKPCKAVLVIIVNCERCNILTFSLSLKNQAFILTKKVKPFCWLLGQWGDIFTIWSWRGILVESLGTFCLISGPGDAVRNEWLPMWFLEKMVKHAMLIWYQNMQLLQQRAQKAPNKKHAATVFISFDIILWNTKGHRCWAT